MPELSTARQNPVETQEMPDIAVPRLTTIGSLHFEPVNTLTSPLSSTAMQNTALTQDSATIVPAFGIDSCCTQFCPS